MARKDEFNLIQNYALIPSEPREKGGSDIRGYRLETKKQFKTKKEAYEFLEKL